MKQTKNKQQDPNETGRFYYCDMDHMGQRSGLYYSVTLPPWCVIERDGLFYSRISVVHKSGWEEPAGTCHLFTSEEQAQRAAWS